MPMGSGDKLEQLYAWQRLLTDEAARLETECVLCGPDEPGSRHYVLKIQIAALYEESSRISARVSDILDRDLQR